MTCHKCGGPTKVIQTRYTALDNSIYRQRECQECSRRAATKERWVVDESSKLSGAQKRNRFYVEIDLRGERAKATIR